MTGMQDAVAGDEDLARRLRAADPARSIEPLAEHRLEDIMTRTATNSPAADTHRTEAPPAQGRRRRLTGVLAGVAAAAAIVTAVFVARPAPDDAVALSLPEDGVMMSCAPISPEFVAASDLAFEGRVTGIDGSTVTLGVLHQYAGETTTTVTIPQGTDELIEMTIGRLEPGQTYLISATDGVVATCGQSGVSTPELKAVYEAAFP